MKTMDASKVRKSFAEIVESVRARQENIVIVRYGQPVAALVPINRLAPRERRSLGADHARRKTTDGRGG